MMIAMTVIVPTLPQLMPPFVRIGTSSELVVSSALEWRQTWPYLLAPAVRFAWNSLTSKSAIAKMKMKVIVDSADAELMPLWSWLTTRIDNVVGAVGATGEDVRQVVHPQHVQATGR